MSEDYNKLFKNGELPYGLYYCRKGDEIRTLQGEGDSLEEEIFYTGEYLFWHNSESDVEILGLVPSWEELQLMNQAMAANVKLIEKEKEFKEVLNDTREYMIEYIISHIGIDPHCRYVMTRLKDVLHLNKVLERKDK